MPIIKFPTAVAGSFLLISLSMKAEIPQTPEFANYAHILERSPFLIKTNEMVQPVHKPKVKINYFLRGVTKLEGGWMIILADRRKPKENIILKQGIKNSADIHLVDVIQDTKDYKLTKANLKIGSELVTVGYNSAELLKTTAQAETVGANPQDKKPPQNQVVIKNVAKRDYTKETPTKTKDPIEGESPKNPNKRVRPVFPAPEPK